MSDALVLAGAVLLNVAGFAWLALGMDVHWKQVRGTSAPQGRARLRWAASAAFLTSLVLCNLTDHASMAALVWVMALTASALLVALTLTWWPACLRPLSRLVSSAADTRSA